VLAASVGSRGLRRHTEVTCSLVAPKAIAFASSGALAVLVLPLLQDTNARASLISSLGRYTGSSS